MLTKDQEAKGNHLPRARRGKVITYQTAIGAGKGVDAPVAAGGATAGEGGLLQAGTKAVLHQQCLACQDIDYL